MRCTLIDEWSEPLIVSVCVRRRAILSRYKVRGHVTKAWRHQHSPELPEADHLPSILSDTSPKEEIGVAFLAAKYVSGLAGLNALIVHGAPPNLGSPESRPPNLMNRVNILF